MSFKKEIFIVGTHCVGKTTLLEELKKIYPSVFYVNEQVEELLKQGKIKKENLNENGNFFSQEKIFEAYQKKFDEFRQKSDKNLMISDRHLLDCWCYTKYLIREKSFPKHEIDKLYNWFKNDIKNMKNKTFVYIPNELGKIYDDGVRSLNKEYQAYIDKMIQQTLIEEKIPFKVVSGSLEKRLQMFEKIIQENTIQVKEYKYTKNLGI